MRFSTICILATSLWLTAPSSSGQTQPAAKPGDFATLDGHILDALTGEPVKKATVTLTPTNVKQQDSLAPGATLPQQFATTSDSSGHFAMKDIDPGSYRMQVTRNGYVAGEYGARGPSKPGT